MRLTTQKFPSRCRFRIHGRCKVAAGLLKPAPRPRLIGETNQSFAYFLRSIFPLPSYPFPRRLLPCCRIGPWPLLLALISFCFLILLSYPFLPFFPGQSWIPKICAMGKIKSIEYFRVLPRWLFVKITDEHDNYGWGEATLEGHSQAVEGCLDAMIQRFVGYEAEYYNPTPMRCAIR